jgi:DNA-binding transcriptional ArsR family regulator
VSLVRTGDQLRRDHRRRTDAKERPDAGRHISTLKALKLAGLVAERPEGRKVFYRAQPQGLAPLVDWMSHYGVFWRERFADLGTLLKEID